MPKVVLWSRDLDPASLTPAHLKALLLLFFHREHNIASQLNSMEPFLRGSTSVKMLQLMILFHLEIITILIYATLIFCIGKLLHVLLLIISSFIYLGENNYFDLSFLLCVKFCFSNYIIFLIVFNKCNTLIFVMHSFLYNGL